MPDKTVSFHEYFKPYLTPNADDVWNETQFVVNPTEGTFDAIVMEQSVNPLSRSYSLHCPPSKTLLAMKEPPDICFFPSGYTRQFYGALGHDSRIQCADNQMGFPGHHWFAEIPINALKANKPFTKEKLISAVVSNKQDTQGHRQRFKLMTTLKAHFGDRLDWFGRGVQDLGDRKLDGLQNYRYHIALENGVWPHYWTEKLADCFAANCVPFYSGAPNVEEYFSKDSIVRIDVNDPEKTIRIIEETLEKNGYEARQTALRESRETLISTYHCYQVYIDQLSRYPDSPEKEVTIRPHNEFSYSVGDRFRNKLWQLKFM